MDTLTSLSPTEQSRLYSLGFYGALGLVHFLCVADIFSAAKGRNWGNLVRQVLIEGMLAMLTYGAYIADCGKRLNVW